MRTLYIAALFGSLTGCKNVDCGAGTIERNGACAPADETIGAAACGSNTMLVGDQCLPTFTPTVCDPATTQEDVDPTTGVVTCIGTGGGGCSAPQACPAPMPGTQTICGQLYDLATGVAFQDSGATGAACTTATPTGPCSLAIQAYDAIAFATDPTTATPLTVGGVDIDDCGRYRVRDITPPSGPFIGLGIDDSAPAALGPTGTTNAVGVATLTAANTATKGFEAWIVTQATTDMWTATGGPTVTTTGVFAAIYRAASTGTATQAGVTFTRNNVAEPTDTFYFAAGDAMRLAVDPTAMMTGANGTALIDNANVADSLAYSGTGGFADTTDCRWETHAGASLPNVVFVQIFRPINQIGEQCPL